jgi:hypothetical protein
MDTNKHRTEEKLLVDESANCHHPVTSRTVLEAINSNRRGRKKC